MGIVGWRASRAVAAAVVAMAVGAGAAEAQYFGRNKVRYESHDVHVLKTEHFDVHYDDKTEETARLVARLAERWNERLSVLLDHTLRGRQPIVFYAGHPDFEQTNTIAGDLPEATGGVTDGAKRRVILPSAGALAETDHVLGHELVHAFQYDIVGRGARTERLPLWFIEGMAEYLSLGPIDTHTAMWLRDAVRSGPLPRVRELDHPKYFPYRYGHALWAYVGGRWGDEKVGQALKLARRDRRGAVRAMEKVLGVKEAELSRDWHASIREAYGPAGASAAPSVAARRKPAKGEPEGFLNLAPALSPDGSRLVFLSERDGGTVELFLADAESGRVQRRLLKRRLDAHFESLQFVGSAGAWAPDGRRFAFAGVRKGRALVSILDADNGRVERDIDLPEVDEVLNPTWSPDGQRIAFSAMRGGVADLFVYDLAAGRLEALSDDAFADLQPAWDPSGDSITFVSDRFSSDLEQLRWGNYRLARFVLATRTIEAVPSFPDAKNVNPQWSGQTLFFVSDRGGVSNVYRQDGEGGAIRQVTELPVGVSGLTALSPALAAAAAAPRLVVTKFLGGRYRLQTIQEPTLLAGCEIEGTARPAMLPPLAREASAVRDLLRDPARGLPDTAAPFSAERYRARLTRDGFAEPFLSVGNDRFGTSVAGGGSLFWSDLLGDHRLSTGLLVNGGIKDLSGIAAYENRARRWNWGLSLQQTTWRTATISSGLGEQDGQTVSLEQLVRFREIDRVVAGHLAYPFARGRRINFSLGYRRVSFATESDVRSFAFDTGKRLGSRKIDVVSPEGLDLAEMGVAFVQDEARFGPTSAIEGTRLRAELTPTLGAKSFLGARFDYRRYLRPFWPVTVAGRVLHYGRYGKDADDPRLAQMFTGYSAFVRGYDGPGAFPCSPRSCTSLDSYMGSKMLVTNLELRAPAFFFLGKGRAYGPIPTEWVLFYDAATTWKNGQAPPIPGASREWIRSWGLGLRVNLFNFMIGELDYIRPLDLPGNRGMVRFRLGAGF